MHLRLGDVLVRRGVLNATQRDQILEEQKRTGRPFGVLAERMFGVRAGAIEEAWAEQYAAMAGLIDPAEERLDPYAHSLIERRQAWQFGVLPMRFEGDELVVCTTQENLARAMRFMGWRIGQSCRFEIAEAHALARVLSRVYPMGGMDASTLTRKGAVA
jgi:hypothetical protein